MTTTITVRGHFSAFFSAERATVSIEVSLQGGNREAVLRETLEVGETVRGSLRDRHDQAAGPITFWSGDRVQTWSHTPTDKEGKPLPVVHTAQLTFSAKFSDFDALASWIEQYGARKGVNVRGISWALTAGRKQRETDAVRIHAVEDAVAKARTYATALGLTTLEPQHIADTGMIGDDVSYSGGTSSAGYSRAASTSSSTLSLKPEDIELTADVDARFAAY
jgi:uncharacterized protein